MSEPTRKPLDPLAMIAALDQAMAGVANIAALLEAYKKALKAAGFTDAEAFQLVIEYQRIALTPRMDSRT